MKTHECDALRAELRVAVDALRRIAKIEIPYGASDGEWAAKSLYCNDMVTAFQVREASAIVAAYDAQKAAPVEGKA